MTQHIHADHIIAAANDTTIQWEYRYSSGTHWHNATPPDWSAELVYRQRPAPHPHQSLMDIAKAEPSIQFEGSKITVPEVQS